MSIKFHILSASKDLAPYATEIERVAQSTTELVKESLPIKNIDIVFYDNPGATIDEVGGIGGFTPNQHTIFISLNLRHPGFKNALKMNYHLYSPMNSIIHSAGKKPWTETPYLKH
jgi:hypothetical protein